MSYDDNGNLLSLRRRGLLASATHAQPKQYGPVDALTYSYAGNRLRAVDDLVTGNQLPRPAGYNGAPTSLAGDFQEQGVRLATEYEYDPNGSLTRDRNKGITAVAYNYLSLPRQVRLGSGADSVVFRYTAAGQKVAKLVYQTGKPTQRTDYLNGFQYEGDSLRFFAHAAGRVLRFASFDAATQLQVRYEREYTLADHLGNLRLAYRLGTVRRDSVSLEQDAPSHGRESRLFDSLSVSPPIALQVGGGVARTGSYVARVTAGGSTPQPLGPLKQLAVQQGDTVTVTAYGLYPQAVQRTSFWFSLASFLSSVLHPGGSAPAGPDPTRGRAGLPLLQVGVAAGLTALPQLSGGVPKGYLRLLVFNSDSTLVSQQVRALSSAALNNYERLRLQVIAPQDGYVSAYVGNESDVDVYFDDVTVELRQGLQVQEAHYDPTGLELAGLTGTTPGLKSLSQYKWNGKEFQTDLGLNWNHQDWRFFDPQLGLWHVTDPEIENGQESWTPYSFGFDNAVRFADADGRYPGGPTNPMDGLKGSGNAASQTDVLSAISTPFKNFAGDALTLSDANDAAVLATTITRGTSGAINFDGTKAGGIGIGFAALGAIVPFVSGSAVRKIAGPALEMVEGRAYGAYKYLRGKFNQAHHIFQDAATRDLAGYLRDEAPTVHLPGHAANPTTPHGKATTAVRERRKLGDGGTYGAERRVAYRGLRAAGIDSKEAKNLVRKADDYFSQLGVNLSTPTRKPTK